jgi:hypothetical protein
MNVEDQKEFLDALEEQDYIERKRQALIENNLSLKHWEELGKKIQYEKDIINALVNGRKEHVNP